MPGSSTPTLSIPGIDDLEPIGRGGFGTVYSGWQEALNRKVAVKVLHLAPGDAGSLARLQREGRAMGALSHHPNVVPVYETGVVNERLYLVMPLLPDGSLADHFASGPLPSRAVVELGRGLADALAAAHEAGVLHRDVKPPNVLLTPHGTYQLADFGVARFVDATQTQGGSLLGTVAYAAPEVLDGRAATVASDVYSLGATLHAALRGQAPYEGGPDDAPLALAVRVLTTPPPDLQAAGVPGALAEVVERAMARDPADRYPSAAAMRDALSGLDLGAPDQAERRAAVERQVTERISAVRRGSTLDLAAAREVTGRTPVVGPAPTLDMAAGTTTSPLPGERTAARARPTPPSRPARPARRGRVLAILALLVLLTGAAVVVLANLDQEGSRERSSGVPPATVETAPPETTAPDTKAAETTRLPEVVTTAPETLTTAPPPEETVSAVQAVRDYYALMDTGRIEEGFARLSAAYRERTGEGSYRAFWQTIDVVEVLDARSDDLVVDATLRYTRTDGTTSTEAVILRFIRDPSTGALLIDDYRLR